MGYLTSPLRLPLGRAEADKLKVVATFSILGDMVRNVGGERIEVTTLVGPNGDAHVYSPTPGRWAAPDRSQGRLHQRPQVRGLDRPPGQIVRHKAAWIEAAKGLKPLKGEDEAMGGHDHGHGGSDPHAWQSIGNAKIYVANIRDALIAADAAGKAAYEANAAPTSSSSTSWKRR